MKSLLTLNLIFLVSLSLFSQKYSFKKNGYYYTKTKTATSDFISTNWNKKLQSKGYVFGVEAILFKENKEISVSDYFYGLFHSKQNNYEASIDFLETYLTFNSNLKSKSNYAIKDSIITFKIFPFTKPTIKKMKSNLLFIKGNILMKTTSH